MPIHYPSEIDLDSFLDDPVVDTPERQDRLRRARRQLRAQRRADDNEGARNRVSRRRCGVEELVLAVGGRQSTSFVPARNRAHHRDSWDRAHPTVASAGPERVNFLPGDPGAAPGTGGELCTIRYRLRSPGRIRRVWLELFRMGDAQALMRVELRWSRANARLEPVDPAGPVRLQNDDLVWDGRLAADDDRVDGQVIDVGSSPYKLKLSVEPKRGVLRDLGEAWTYFDVLVDSITLEWGDPTVIPQVRRDVTGPNQAAVRNYEVALVQDLQANAVDGNGHIDANPHRILLDSNLFTTDLDGQSKTDRPFRLYRDMWGDGPLLPIFVNVNLRRSNGAVVAAAAAPWALGAAEFLWDWEDDTPATKVNQWAGATPQRTRDFLDATLDYLVDIDADLGEAPRDANNCHAHHGGKRGRGAALVFPGQLPMNYLPTTGALIAQDFPFAVARCQERRWASVSVARKQGVEAGRTGAMFQPSRIAGDRYRVAVYLSTPDFPHDETGANLRASPIPHAHTGVFEVWRRVRARIYRADGTVGNPNAATVTNIFSEARVLADLPAPATVNVGQWDDAFYAGLADYFDNTIKIRPWLGAMLATNQAGPDCLQLEDPTNAAARMQALAAAGLHELTVNGAIDDLSFRPGEPVEHTPSGTRGLVIHRESAVGGNYTVYVEHALGQHLAAGQVLTVIRGGIALTVVANQHMNTAITRPLVQTALLALDDGTITAADYRNLSKGVSFRVMQSYADTVHPGDRAVFTFLFEQMGTHGGEPRAGGTNSSIATEHRAFAYLQDDPALAVGGLKAYDLVTTHEIGHALFLPHSPHERDAKKRVHIAVPDGEDDNCVMNYAPTSQHFCGLCMLRLMGWSVHGQFENDNNDANLVRLANKGSQNKRDFELTSLTATLPVTPPRTVRQMHNTAATNVPVRVTIQGSEDEDLATNAPIVLLTDSANARAPLADAQRQAVCGPLRLEAQGRVPAGSQFVWKIERLDDHADVVRASAQPTPGVQLSGASGEFAEVQTNATGSFRVKVSVNVDGGARFDDDLRFLCFNLVLVKVERLESDHTFRKHPGYTRVNAGDVEIKSEDRNDDSIKAVELKTRIRLIGGGQDGKLGLDKVHAGWINNVRSDDAGAEYLANDGSGTRAKGAILPLHRAAAGAVSARMAPPPGNAHPVVDKRTFAQDITNWTAAHAVLSTATPSAHQSLDTVIDNQPVGGRCWIENKDSPLQGWDIHPPTKPGLDITRIWVHTQFTAYLSLWTESAPQLVGVVEELPWTMDADYEADATGTRRTRQRLTVRKQAKTKHRTLVNAIDTGLEWTPPSSLGDHEPRFFPAGEEPDTHLGFQWDHPTQR